MQEGLTKEQFLEAQRAQRAAAAKRAAQRKADVQRDAGLAAATTVASRPVWGLELVLQSEKGIEKLMAFCAIELSEENLKFLLEATKWHQNWYKSDEDTRTREALALIDVIMLPRSAFSLKPWPSRS